MTAVTTLPSAREAIDRLQALDGALPELGLVLDADRHAELLGFATVVERMRYKPGASAVAAVRDAQGERHWIHTNAAAEKLEKGEQRAARVGERVSWVTPRTQTGAAFGDRLLAPIVARLLRDDPVALDGASVRKYNPHRRLVLRGVDRGGPERAIRLSAHPTELGDEVARMLARAGLPVLAPERLRRGVTATRWWGADLERQGSQALERTAGAALARLHRVPQISLPSLPSIDAARAAADAAEAIGVVLPSLVPRARNVAERLADALPGRRDEVLVHGDWSLDQVLSDGHEIRFIDFDRVALAPAERDLGSALACGASGAALEGYRDAGGRLEPRALDAWTSLAMLERAIEPFRTGQQQWPAAMEHELRRAEEALA